MRLYRDSLSIVVNEFPLPNSHPVALRRQDKPTLPNETYIHRAVRQETR